MLKKIVDKILRHRHPWRDISFNELSEIYVTMMMRSLAISMTGIFIPVYLYQLHYSITAITSVFAMYFTARIVLDFAAAYTVARIGPKHTLVIGQFLQIATSAMFLTLPQMHWSLLLVGIVWGSSASFFFIPFHIDFSKVKHAVHGGKEIGFEQIMEKIGFALGPLVGGVVATVLGPRYIFLVSIVMLIGGLWPLFRTEEPVRVHQKLHYSGLHLSKIKRHLPSYVGLNVENTLCLMLWPLYLAVVVIPGTSVFAKIGLLASVSVLFSITAAHTAGKKVDNHDGRRLLRISATINGLIHFCRPFVTLYPVAFGLNILNEIVTIGYRLPFTKGVYDLADDLPGYRIVFISTMEALGCMVKASIWWLLCLSSTIVTIRIFFVLGFSIAACASFLIMSEKFEALDPVKV